MTQRFGIQSLLHVSLSFSTEKKAKNLETEQNDDSRSSFDCDGNDDDDRPFLSPSLPTQLFEKPGDDWLSPYLVGPDLAPLPGPGRSSRQGSSSVWIVLWTLFCCNHRMSICLLVVNTDWCQHTSLFSTCPAGLAALYLSLSLTLSSSADYDIEEMVPTSHVTTIWGQNGTVFVEHVLKAKRPTDLELYTTQPLILAVPWA